MYLVIGSTAAHAALGGEWRRPKDLDAFVSPDAQNWGTARKADMFWHEDLTQYWGLDTYRFATLDELYTLKISHSYWELENNTWLKHITDAMLLKRHGAELIPDLHRTLYGIWEQKHGKKQVDLDMDKREFFADAVQRRWDHDSVHDSVAYFEEPLYNRILKDGAQVGVDMRKLKALPFQLQVMLFREEIYATALERIMIPRDYDYSPSAAYQWALRRVITSLTKGWSATFIADHYETFRHPDVDYVAKHRKNAHMLVPYEKGK